MDQAGLPPSAADDSWRTDPSIVSVLRPADHLVLDLTLVNLRLSDDGTALVRVDEEAEAVLVVRFGSQHASERAFLLSTTTKEPVGAPPVATLAAGRTRLAFTVPDDVRALPFTLAGLLDWDALEPRLSARALPPGATDGPAPSVEPGADETALEVPHRLVVSPDTAGRWAHRTAPFAEQGRVEVWRTRLGADGAARVRALWRRPGADTFRSALTTGDLDDLVTLTSDYRLRPKGHRELGADLRIWSTLLDISGLRGYHYPPVPLTADTLVLSTLGATARLRGTWDYPPPDKKPSELRWFGMPNPSLIAYDHVIGQGRDQLVRVVRRGYLSTGHRAAQLTVTERVVDTQQLRVEETERGPVGIFGGDGVLRQWSVVVVLQPRLDYAALARGYGHAGREMPFRTLTVRPSQTPPLDDEPNMTAPTWLRVGGADFGFTLTGTDWAGDPVTLTAPLMFVPDEAAGNAGAVRAAFLQGPGPRRRWLLHGQAVSLADAGRDPGRPTRVPTESITLDLRPVTAGDLRPAYAPSWLPRVTAATVHLEAVQRVTGQGAGVPVSLHPAYLAGGLAEGGNAAGSFLRLTTPQPLAFGAAGGGGVARPDARLEVVTTRVGAVADAFTKPAPTLAELAGLFGAARLFGTIRLTDVLDQPPPLSPADFVALADPARVDALLADPAGVVPIPVLRTRLRGPADPPLYTEATEARYVWKPALRSTSLLVFGPGASLVLDLRVTTPRGGAAPTREVRGELRDVTLRLAGIASLHLDRLAFTQVDARKPDLTVEGCALTFEGPLEFVNTLREVFPGDGFSDPPAVSVGADGVATGYSLEVPSVVVGVFSLQNLTLAAQVSLPFVERPVGLRFAVSERHRPFLVTVSLFGGGGFFALEVGARGVETVEAAIEFGASVALDLGVASGGVSVMAGVYFGLTGDRVDLTGYLRCAGHLSVLGLVSISVEFYLAFSYRAKGAGRSEVWGQARVTVCVEVLCFSASVSLQLERRFAGSGGDPTFAQCLDPVDFEEYCLAFAEEGR